MTEEQPIFEGPRALDQKTSVERVLTVRARLARIQGDYEYFEFDRERLSELALELLAYFELSTTGLRNL